MMDFSEKENAPTRQYHPTFTNKPLPTLQMLAQHSHLNDEGRSSNAYKNPGIVAPTPEVPTTWDTVYDPDHPDADWTGLVSRTHMQKRHMQHHRSQQEGIERNEQGIVSREEKQEWSRKRGAPDGAMTKNSGSLVIGGIDQPDERWKTAYSRFENRESTARDQLTLDKRQNAIKRIPDPAQSQSVRTPRNSDNPLYSAHPSPRDYDAYQRHQQSQAVTRMAPISARSNLLSGLGEKIVSRGSVSVPADLPRQPRPNENYRVLMGDNYKPFPGYTGQRK